MAFDGNEGDIITPEEAGTLTGTYRTAHPNWIKGNFMGADILKQILDQEGCKGIRMYYGMNDKGEMDPVFVGVDENEDDIIGLIGEGSIPCPTRCGRENLLNR